MEEARKKFKMSAYINTKRKPSRKDLFDFLSKNSV